jgi:hypothetical protein
MRRYFSGSSGVASRNRLLRLLASFVSTFAGLSPIGDISLSVCVVSTRRARGLLPRIWEKASATRFGE